MSESYAYGMWPLVLINAGLIIFFALGFLKPKKRWEWRSLGTLTAFVVALFTEMYGFPLTIYLLTSWLGSKYPVTNPFTHGNGNLLAVFTGGSEFFSGLLMFLGTVVIFAGFFVMASGWRQIHRANGQLVTWGIYSLVRHPQYFGLFIITLGMFIQWPTLSTAIMWPALMFMYYRLARREEKEVKALFGEKYEVYRREVPMFLPHLTQTLPCRIFIQR